MPGTKICLKSSGQDPDPTSFLFISPKIKDQIASKQYDPKRSCYVPDQTNKFTEGLIKETAGGNVQVEILDTKEVKTFEKENVTQVNPPKYDCCEDMSSLTFLNDASVLFNLTARYLEKLIYTYSGLFCIAVNPYKRFPIYTLRTVDLYRGKRRNEVPPHIFAIAEGSYHAMCLKRKNQSILITGESGAGKTENTKKVITYFAFVGSQDKDAKKEISKKKASLEDQVVQTNPVMEAFGNAKTVRNDNSSRFGKFIRVWFNNAGKMAGGDIETYLLEKSRVTYQSPNERSYHIFYFLTTHAVDLRESCLLSENVKDYPLMSMGKIKVDSIEDDEEMQIMDEAFDILGFSTEEKTNVYKVVAACMHLSRLEFNGHGEITTPNPKNKFGGEDANKLLDFSEDTDELYDRFSNPKFKVGMEWVTKAQNLVAVNVAVGSIIKNIFGRLFRYLVDMCNATLIDPSMKKVNYIGVLDIAGFEIFEFNTFEQICINFVNEKLQQFFNHHMFVLEQEEYMREGIEWVSVDFGMDLASCIELFEKPMGILPILEEETIYPKASDETFHAKMNAQHLGKHKNYGKPCGKAGKDSHFSIVHYAGTVNYNLVGWLDKNRDPINDSVVDLLKKTKSCKLMNEIYADHLGQTKPEEDIPLPGHRRGKRRVIVQSKTAAKMANFKTVCSYFKDQLNNLVNMLMSTEPSFIRCIVPNSVKKPGIIDPYLVMHQLTCNGVLEGIRICRKGFPNRVVYVDFKTRYAILAIKEAYRAMKQCKRPHTEEKKAIAATHAIMDSVNLVGDKFQYGHTKIFFRAGVLGLMEELRDGRVEGLVTKFQGAIRMFNAQKIYKKLWDHKKSLLVAQRAIRNHMMGKTWLWWSMWITLKPGLKSGSISDTKKKLANRIVFAKDHFEDVIKEKEKAAVLNEKLISEITEIKMALNSGTSAKDQIVSKIEKIEDIANDIQQEIGQCEKQIVDEEEKVDTIIEELANAEDTVCALKNDAKKLETKLNQIKENSLDKESQVNAMKTEVMQQEQMIHKLNKEKKEKQESQLKNEDTKQSFDDKATHLGRLKLRLEQTLDEVEDSFERERKHKLDIEKIKRQTEGTLKHTIDTASTLERNNIEVQQKIQQKEKEHSSVLAKIDDEETLSGKLNLQIKELLAGIEELDIDIETERHNRARIDKAAGAVRREVDELYEKIEEAGNNTSTQVVLNARREEEIGKLKMSLDEANISFESSLCMMRQKHNAVISEMGDQTDALTKCKANLENDRNEICNELEVMQKELKEAENVTLRFEKNGKNLQFQMHEKENSLSEIQRALNEADLSKRKLMIQNCDITHKFEENEKIFNQLKKDGSSLEGQLEDAKKLADTETKDRITLMGTMKNLEYELEVMNENLDQENEHKHEIKRQLSKSFADILLWKTRYETEGVTRVDELERDKSKATSRLEEGEDTIKALQDKIAHSGKTNIRNQAELEELRAELDRHETNINIIEKRSHTFDKTVQEWQLKEHDFQNEISNSQTEARNFSSEYFRLKSALEEMKESYDTIKRENKNLAEEVKDLLEQLGDGGRSIHDLDKCRRRLEIEKDELKSALEEAETCIEQEENKNLRAQLEMAQVRQEIDRRIQEKEEEFSHSRNNHQRSMDSMQASLEAEARSKDDMLRIKKKLETAINQSEIALDHANKANNEYQKNSKRTLMMLNDVNCAVSEEVKLKNEIEEQFGLTDRKFKAMNGEMEEAKALLETAIRGQRQVEQELSDTNEQFRDISTHNAEISRTKRDLENDIQQLKADMDNVLMSTKNNEELAKRAMVDAGRLADELRVEQDHTATEEKVIKCTKLTIAEMQKRHEEISYTLARGAAQLPEKLEAKIAELEVELIQVIQESDETHKRMIKGERRIKESLFQKEENEKNKDRIVELIEKLQLKLKSYKKQIEEAEEIAAINLAKFRKGQQDLEEAEERTLLAEESIGKIRRDGRSISAAPAQLGRNREGSALRGFSRTPARD